MKADKSPSVDEIVRQAATLDGEEQIAFVKRTCAGDSELYREALDRLKNHDWWNLSLEHGAAVEATPTTEWEGRLIGNYRVLRVLGQGGMGEVLLSQRADDEFHKHVAIKLVRQGVQSKQTQGRLKIERQILATLDHPNIARLLDGGTTEHGTPYLVMEYIDGLPIDEYCDQQALTINQRLDLFRKVCSAVHAAHQNLIVHRDLKPTNILVTQDGVPKLLDFGIAKMLDDRSLLHTMAVTQVDVRIMTPEHASPEQVRGDVITTSSDIYSLGVLLYELLAGVKPYVFTSQRLADIERSICDEAPLPLNTAFIDTDPSLTETICQGRATSLARLRRDLSGDVANIVSMSLRKEPERRYPSAEQFSADIGQYLNNLPVMARPDTWSYRAQTFVRRHTLGVAATVVAVLGLTLFAITATLQARRIAREQLRTERVSTFLLDLFRDADPSQSRDVEVSARQIVDAGAQRLMLRLDDEPDTRATLQATIGQVYNSLGVYDQAIELLQRSLAAKRAQYGNDHVEVAAVLMQLGNALSRAEKLSDAVASLSEAHRIYERNRPTYSLELARSTAMLGNLKRQEQQLPEAERLLRESLAMLEPLGSKAGKDTLDALNNLALVFDNRGDYAGEEQIYRRALDLSSKQLGTDHPDVAAVTLNLAIVIQRQNRIDEAAPLFENALSVYRRVLGPEHPRTLAALINYGEFLRRKGDTAKALQVLRETIALDQKIRGPKHSSVGYDLVRLGLTLALSGEYAQAEQSYRQALEIFDASLPPNHQYLGWASVSLGTVLLNLNRDAEAERHIRRALDVYSKSLPEGNLQLELVRGALGRSIAAQKRFTEAEPLLLNSYRALLKTRSPDDQNIVRLHGWIEDLYRQWHRDSEAEKFFASVQPISK